MKNRDLFYLVAIIIMLSCMVMILSSNLIGISGQNNLLKLRIQQLEQLNQQSKVPDGFQVISLTLDGYQETKTPIAIQSIEKEEKSLKTDVVSRGDVSRKELSVVTAYSWTGNKTAIGTYPVEGRTCAGPRWIPLGTLVYIEGVGERIVEDRTHLRFNGRYDVYMDSEDACWEFGKKNLNVEVLK